jgi:hypothetical protein
LILGDAYIAHEVADVISRAVLLGVTLDSQHAQTIDAQVYRGTIVPYGASYRLVASIDAGICISIRPGVLVFSIPVSAASGQGEYEQQTGYISQGSHLKPPWFFFECIASVMG